MLPAHFVLEIFMKLVQSLLAFALASAMGSAAAVGPGYLGNLSGNSFAVGNTFGPSAVFNDIYSFDIMPLSSVAGTAVTINIDIPFLPGPEFAIGNFSIAFKDSIGNILAFDNTLSNNALSISTLLPADMGYQFVVSGKVIGTLGGTYGGALAAAPIPEAETYAMMLAGLGLIGFMVSRRRST